MSSPNSRRHGAAATTETGQAVAPDAGREATHHQRLTRRELRSTPVVEVPPTRGARSRAAQGRVTWNAGEQDAAVAQTIARALVVETVAAEAVSSGSVAPLTRAARAHTRTAPTVVDVEQLSSARVYEEPATDEAPAQAQAQAPALAFERPVFDIPAADAVADAAPSEASVERPVFAVPAAEPATSDAAAEAGDEFAAASRLFAESGVTTDISESAEPAPVEAEAEAEVEVEHIELPEHLAPRRRSRFSAKRITATALSVGVVGCIMTLTVAMAFPAAPVGNNTARTVASSIAGDEDIQAFVASSDVQNTTGDRSANYESITAAQIAAESGINYSSDVFNNDPTSAIQWPFAVGTGMSYGYGMRDGRMHEGIDFTPGEGAPIQSIADGTVRVATENGGGYGVHVFIDHVVDGQTISSHYAHMLYGSLRVKAGQQVKVGDVVGLTGDTGHSFGAHLHFELIVNGATIDPMPWLKEHAG